MNFKNREQFLAGAGLFEFSLMLVALILGWFFSVEPTATFEFAWKPALYGALAAVPLFLIFLGIEMLPLPSIQKVQETVLETIGRYLSNCNHLELAMLALLAGIGEEILFRGFLMTWIESFAGYYWGLAVSSLAFGLMHAVTWVYTIFAGAAGAYFGLVYDMTGERNLIAPVMAHAVYDYLAFLVIVRDAKKSSPAEEGGEMERNFESEEESFRW